MQVPPFSSRPVAAAMLLMLALTSLGASPGAPAAPVDGIVSDTQVTIGKDGADVRSETTVEGVATVNASIELDPNLPAVLGTGSHATFAFDLPLFDRGHDERFRFRDADGTRAGSVNITVTWRDGTGEPKPFPEGRHDPVELVIATEGVRLRYEPTHRATPSQASFEVPFADLVHGRATAWTIMAHAPNEDLDLGVASIGVLSAYNRHGESEGFLEAVLDDVLDVLATPVWVYDTDEDGLPNDYDNCPRTANPNQENLDGDLHGDACDRDMDGDGHANDVESAAGSNPRDAASTPLDRDGDGYPNDDETAAGSDPDDAASTPLDADADGYSTADEEAAGSDPHNPASTPADPDADGLEDADDNCPTHSNADQVDGDADGIGDACDNDPDDGPLGDADGDGLSNEEDLCPHDPDAAQVDLDGDGRGDDCDRDRDGDGHPNRLDTFPDDRHEWSDHDEDGTGDNADSDDDNDGLSDDAEAATGTSPLNPDTDGDRLSDLDETRLGSDPLNGHDPEYRPTDVTAAGLSDGSVRIEWTGTSDARVDRYTVWERSSLRVVATIEARGATTHAVTDFGHDGGDALYAVQAHFHDGGDAFVRADAVDAHLYAEEVTAWAYEAPKDLVLSEPTRTTGPTAQAPVGGVQGLPAPSIWLAGGALGVFLLRRRR